MEQLQLDRVDGRMRRATIGLRPYDRGQIVKWMDTNSHCKAAHARRSCHHRMTFVDFDLNLTQRFLLQPHRRQRCRPEMLSPARSTLLHAPALRHHVNRSHWRLHRREPPPARRAFSSTRPQRSELLESAYTGLHTLITTLHSSTGLPWAASLPLAALTIRTLFVLPLSAIQANNRAKVLALRPETLAARPALEREVISKHSRLGPQQCTALLAAAMGRKQAELRRARGISRWEDYVHWLQFPVWFAAIETVRRMAGADFGLLGSIFGSGEGGGHLASTGADMVNASDVALNPFFAPSMAVEGALWFPDLLVADPNLVLPFVLSAILYASVAREEAVVVAATLVRPRWSIRLTRIMKALAVAIGPATLQVPAALLVYWIASAASAVGQKMLLDRFYPRSLGAEAIAAETGRPPAAAQRPRSRALGAVPVGSSKKGYVPRRK